MFPQRLTLHMQATTASIIKFTIVQAFANSSLRSATAASAALPGRQGSVPHVLQGPAAGAAAVAAALQGCGRCPRLFGGGVVDGGADGFIPQCGTGNITGRHQIEDYHRDVIFLQHRARLERDLDLMYPVPLMPLASLADLQTQTQLTNPLSRRSAPVTIERL